MPRTTRVSDVRPRQPPRLRTTTSNSDPVHHRPIPDRSPKLGERRSPRSGPNSDPVNKKKIGPRIADLESQLSQAQEELKVLKHQLASAEAAKKDAQGKLEKKVKKLSHSDRSVGSTKTHRKSSSRDEVPGENQQETDVFEVPMETVAIEPTKDLEPSESVVEAPDEPPASDTGKRPLSGLSVKEEEVSALELKLDEKEKEIGRLNEENTGLKKLLNEADSDMSFAKVKEEDTTSRLSQLEEELKASKINEAELRSKLEALEGSKGTLEAEMKKLRVQTEQWRKAADAAAAVLAGGAEMNGRISERCVSMDKQFGGFLEPTAGLVDYPVLAEDTDEGFGSGKRKGSGIKMFGELWKKKGQK